MNADEDAGEQLVVIEEGFGDQDGPGIDEMECGIAFVSLAINDLFQPYNSEPLLGGQTELRLPGVTCFWDARLIGDKEWCHI